ncbi:asparagine synthase (glutamine-hydrolyzing) [Flavisolibacter sp. BT320]|nr:asparagine synthase (glutamine-hydrolyzing) [Flavisolibacter longurius]
MCGITGAFAFTKRGRESAGNVTAATEAITKRGPDFGNTFIEGSVALGHRRLSIIDVSCNANQPMFSRDGRYCIIFNGEIFNYKELIKTVLNDAERDALVTSSDTEVFLCLFQKHKEKAFSLLRGFFAAAIYDRLEDSLVLVRDRMGKKPLLYYRDEDKLVFGSEMKALFAFGIPRKLEWQVLPYYLQLNYVPQPLSLIENVQKVEPGHYLTVTSEGVQSKAYHKLSIQKDSYGHYQYEGAKEKLVVLMEEAVRLRLIADVPLGAFLSGGIDSSVVVAMAARHTNHLKTYSIGYRDNPFFDETYYANLVADKYKTDHTVFSLTNDDFLTHLHSILDYIDEPFADSSAIPQYILCYHTRKHVTVALSGDGGDEVFAGYNKHAAEWRMRQGGVLNSLVKIGQPLWAALPQSRSGKLTNTVRQLHRFASGARLNEGERYWQWASLQTSTQALQLLSSTSAARIDHAKNGFQQQVVNWLGNGDFNEVLLADMNLVLLSDMLVKVDSMSMANSLEVRSPFLDQEVVNFAFGLPSAYKINGQLKKRIVQDAFRSYLPEELYNRPKKGFEIPLLQWLRKELWGLINDDLLSDAFVAEQGVFSLPAIQRLKAQLQSANPQDSHATIWALLVFQYWWKKFELTTED